MKESYQKRSKIIFFLNHQIMTCSRIHVLTLSRLPASCGLLSDFGTFVSDPATPPPDDGDTPDHVDDVLAEAEPDDDEWWCDRPQRAGFRLARKLDACKAMQFIIG